MRPFDHCSLVLQGNGACRVCALRHGIQISVEAIWLATQRDLQNDPLLELQSNHPMFEFLILRNHPMFEFLVLRNHPMFELLMLRTSTFVQCIQLKFVDWKMTSTTSTSVFASWSATIKHIKEYQKMSNNSLTTSPSREYGPHTVYRPIVLLRLV